MTEEPEAMKEIHRIREKMYEEFKGLSIHEIARKVTESAEREMARIQSLGVAEKKRKYKEKKE